MKENCDRPLRFTVDVPVNIFMLNLRGCDHVKPRLHCPTQLKSIVGVAEARTGLSA